MSSKHTPGFMQAFNGYLLRICHGEVCTSIAEIRTPYRHGIGIFKGQCESDANIRRLAAAWNACDGSSTEWLEFQTNPDAIDQFGRREPFETRYRTALQNGVKAVEQRDELLKALKGLLAVVNIAEAGNDGKPHQYLQSRSGSMVFSADAVADAMAAIAKAGSVDLPPVGFAPLCPDGHSSGA